MSPLTFPPHDGLLAEVAGWPVHEFRQQLCRDKSALLPLSQNVIKFTPDGDNPLDIHIITANWRGKSIVMSLIKAVGMNESERTFIRGNRNPHQYGFSLRASNGIEPDRMAIEHAAPLLGREPFLVDKRGYECELIGAAVHSPTNRVAYLESRAKKRWWSSMVDISIKIHLRDPDGNDRAVHIKSYNPFFGCDIGFFQWVDDTALLIYTEKHRTYICVFGDEWPPKFVEIEDYWIINGRTLGYIGYKQELVKRISIPDLNTLDSISKSDADTIGLLPEDPYAT